MECMYGSPLTLSGSGVAGAAGAKHWCLKVFVLRLIRAETSCFLVCLAAWREECCVASQACLISCAREGLGVGSRRSFA